jgi:hypothetical protein
MSEQDNKQENIEEQIGIDAEIHLGDEVYASYNGPYSRSRCGRAITGSRLNRAC